MGRKRDAKCDSKCDSKFQYLWLRNGIFYHRIELPRVDGKRRYKRVSLHTDNFYEAREKIKNMNNPNSVFDKLQRLYNSLIFETDDGRTGNLYAISDLPGKKKLSKRNKRETIEDLFWSYTMTMREEISSLRAENKALLSKIEAIVPEMQEFMRTAAMNSPKAPASLHTISEVLESMLFIGRNVPEEQVRKRNAITKLLSEVGLKPEDSYSKFHNASVVETIARNIDAQVNVKGNQKRKLVRYIKELATRGSTIDPDNYKPNVISNLPNIEKTKKAEKNPYKPYTKEQLLEIFDPKYTYFKENPDAFFVCLIALFTGARINSALTLQYNDVLIKDCLNCIQFIENHPIKHLKNEASERIVPIHNQLLDVGFVDYVRNNEKLLKAKGDDFIFPKCKTSGGIYNNKYTDRNVLKFFKSIGVKTSSNDGLAFHSFRKNASLALQDAGIAQSCINDIIGWEGKNTMEQSYSNRTLAQIKTEMDKFGYDLLKPHFAEWKKIWAEK